MSLGNGHARATPRFNASAAAAFALAGIVCVLAGCGGGGGGGGGGGFPIVAPPGRDRKSVV